MGALFIMIIFTSICTFFLVRSILILIGLYKEPIIRTFAEYGPRENLYLPALPLFAWTGALLFLSGMWAAPISRLSFLLTALAVVLGLLTAVGYNNYATAEKYHTMLLPYPRWYHELRERTTRYERRRIGFMWLHLPARCRLSYNSSDYLFFIWADFIIMGTIREEELNPKDEEFFYTGH
ncbi:MAG: hypothetical protein R3E39_00745 [Anaerolineae bacterium]